MRPRAFEEFEALERDHWWFRGRRRVYVELLRDALAGERPLRVLDAGAGVGGFLDELAALGGELVHSELEPAALARCRARGHGRGVRASVEALPFRDESFDLVCLFDVLEHADDDRAVAAEVARVLRPEGLLVATVPAHPWLFTKNDRVAGHRRRYTRRALRLALALPELELLRCTYANALLFPAIAAFLLAARSAEALGLGGADPERTNLSWRAPRWCGELAYRAFSAELLLSRRLDLPLGHSLLALARRREATGHAVLLRPQRPAEMRSGAAARVSPTALALAARGKSSA